MSSLPESIKKVTYLEPILNQLPTGGAVLLQCGKIFDFRVVYEGCFQSGDFSVKNLDNRQNGS